MTGTIRHYNADRGFGFVTAEDGKEYFAHIKDVTDLSVKQLNRGDFVSFDLQDGPKGVRAVQIEILPTPAKADPPPADHSYEGSLARGRARW